MRKKRLTFYCITLAVICQGLAGMVLGRGVLAVGISERQRAAIVDHCGAIRDSLKSVQKQDARTRVYLGGRYETILSKFVVPLNIRLVENNLSNAELIENQNDFAERKVKFVDDYISYQQKLEELIGMDCRGEPERFYEKLTEAREKRKVVSADVTSLRNLISRHVRLVKGLTEEL